MAVRSDYRTSQTYLSRHYFDDAKLREFAIDEFMRCMRSRKMVAFVGSMASQKLGYPAWDGLFDNAIEATKTYLNSLDKRYCDLVPELEEFVKNLRYERKFNNRFDGRVLASAIGLWVDNKVLRDDSGDRINEELARLLERKGECAEDYATDSKIIGNLNKHLGIRNYITTNYDLEIEFSINQSEFDVKSKRYLNLRDCANIEPVGVVRSNRLAVPNTAISPSTTSRGMFDVDTVSFRTVDAESIHIKLPDGNMLVADAFDRDRLDRLIEFSVGSADVDYHVLHLHGHVWRPRSMVVSYRDYDRLYRRSGASKHPFEQTLSLLYSSNPIVFVGLGMNEAELNSALEELVGNQPFKGVGRRFLLWAAPGERGPLVEELRAEVKIKGKKQAVRYDGGKEIAGKMTKDEVKANFRLEKLHKLGVLTIFDDELDLELAEPIRKKEVELDNIKPPKNNKEQRLATFVEKLGKLNDYRRRAARKADHPDVGWRQVDFRKSIQSENQQSTGPVRFTWQFVRNIDPKGIEAQDAVTRRLKPADWSMRVITSRPGTQKGTQAEVSALAWSYPLKGADGKLIPDPNRPSMLVNASLRLDTDSMLESMCQFLCETSGVDRLTGKRSRPGGKSRQDRPKDSLLSRESLFDARKLFRPLPGKKPLLVFRGLERLFNKSGMPLSAELDNFFRSYLRAAIETKDSSQPKRLCRVIVYGSRRVRVYFRELQRIIEKELSEGAKSKEKAGARVQNILVIERNDDAPSGYLVGLSKTFKLPGYEELTEAVEQMTAEVPLAEDRAFAKRTFERIFASEHFQTILSEPKDRNLAFAIMTVMAFIGQPVEREVLLHIPRIIEALDQYDLPSGAGAKLDEVFQTLQVLDLVNKIGRPTIGPEVKAKSKAKSASPKSAAKAAGPEASKTKEADPGQKEYHSDRFALHKSLQIEFRERYGVPLSEAALSTSFNMSLFAAQPADSVLPEPEVHDELGKMIDWLMGAHKDLARKLDAEEGQDTQACRALPQAAAALRAALALMRGFYSTTALLSLDLDDRLVSERRDGALTEHADRIERLIRAFELMAKQRHKKERALRNKKSKEKMSPIEIADALGPGPIYKDELVWLHNERGVVKLAQGDLYEARHSLDAADTINRKYVEFSCRSHNWRRIWLNQLAVDFERGKLAEAEDRIGRIEASLHSAAEIEKIRKVLCKLRAGAQPILPLHVSHEDCLAVALTTGYRALIQFQRGELPDSDKMFKVAIEMLQSLDEQRACALMRRYYASLLRVLDGEEAMASMAKLASAGAESYQQMDIVYGARIIRHHKHAISDRADDRLVAMRTFTRALEWATQTDIHRTAIEARRSLAGLKLQNGDYESALEHARIAMALAGRYGFSLFKISIRILLGRILIARDNEPAGMALIRNAISQADRLGYQRGIDAAQFALQTIVRGR